ncbi:aminodeoxychorismate synthase component I [Nocardia aobensis]|uniref:Aminodeoxychorismate synthase component I n=1 Tax=Nocardia aobensis TaxID=257277 RepID=A0ABW6PFF3_9NOCA
MSNGAAWGRFDDINAGTALRFSRAQRELVATEPAQVPLVLAEVDRASSEGLWSFGYVSYEAAAGLDATLAVHPPLDGLPLVWFGIADRADRVPLVEPSAGRGYDIGRWDCRWSRDEHRLAVQNVHDQIAAGETYQCNLTTRLDATFDGGLDSFYGDLAHAQGGSYNAYLDTGRFVVASASPELFFETQDDRILLRPMKGTAPRGNSHAHDDWIASQLRASAKERAENIMIVDLIRNDVARVAVVGGVSVTALCRVERYRTVHQMTSDVVARLRPDAGLLDIFSALFPCGSVTGAPKARTMALIRELEPTPRGVYCGAVGVVAPYGTRNRLRFNVAIRTLVADRARGIATYGTGGGITWDSVATAEYDELQAKTAVLTAATSRGSSGGMPVDIGHLSRSGQP